jgi:hypothetical protein
MADTHFVWYDSKGRKHIAPITPFLVPDGVTLGPPHSWLRDRNEFAASAAIYGQIPFSWLHKSRHHQFLLRLRHARNLRARCL